MWLQVKFEEIYDRLDVIEYSLFFLRMLGLCVCIQFIIGLSYIVRETSKHMGKSECPMHTLPQDKKLWRE